MSEDRVEPGENSPVSLDQSWDLAIPNLEKGMTFASRLGRMLLSLLRS